MQILGPVIDLLGQNYRPLETDATFGKGHLWQKINREEGSNLEQYYNGMTFEEEAPTTSFLKTMGLIAGGSLFFAGATAYHLGKTGYESFNMAKGIWERFRLAKNEGNDVKPWSFIQSQDSQIYQPALQSASQMIKSYACWIPFAMLPLPHLINPPTWFLPSLHPAGWLTDTNLGFYVGLVFIAYAMYDPRYPKVVLNQLETWVVAPPTVSSVPEDEDTAESEGSSSTEAPKKVEDLYKAGFQYRIQELFEFKVPISHYLGWETVDQKLKKKKDE